MIKSISFYCFLDLLLLVTINAENIPPKIVKWGTTKELFVPPKAANFTCGANGTGKLDFEWYKDGMKIVTSDSKKYEIIKESKLGIQSEKLGLLQWGRAEKFVQPEDEGFYQCKVKNTHGLSVSDRTWLRRYHLEAGSSTKETKEYNVGDAASLPCEEKAKSSSSPLVEWVKIITSDSQNPVTTPLTLGERLQVDENGTLCFSYVIESDETRDDEDYACVLRNSLDTLTSVVGSKYKIKVGTKTPSNPTSLKTMFAYVNPNVALVKDTVTLSCFFSGSKHISVSITDSKGHNIASSSISPVETSKGATIIKNVQKSHQGEYICTGINEENTLSKTETLQVIVEEKPTFTNQPQDQNAVHGSNAEFRCSVIATPPAKIEWFKNGELLKEDKLPHEMYLSPDRTTLKIQNLCKEGCAQGQNGPMVIQCNASNVHGYAFANGYLNILFKTEITEKPQDVEYNPEKNATFHCDAKTDPDTKLSYKWLFNDETFTHGSINTTTKVLHLNLPNLEEKGKNLIGKWTCMASNSHTSDKQSALLREKYVPAYVWPYWWAVLLALLLFLLVLIIICIICCCLYQNRGDQYPVDEIEQKNGNNPEKELEEAGFHDYQRDPLLPRSDSASGTLSSQERTISRQKRSQGSLSGTLGRGSNENLNG